VIKPELGIQIIEDVRKRGVTMEVKRIPDMPAASSSLRVIEIDPQTDHRWEALATSISASPTPVYHPDWLKVLEEIYSYKPAHLACEDTDGQLVGILPLFYRRGWRSGRSFTSVFTGVLAHNDQSRIALLQAAIERTRTHTGVQLHLRIMSHPLDALVDGVVGVPAYQTFLLALPERAELLPLNSSLKRAINKASKEGVKVRPAETERDLWAWYELYVETMRKLSVWPKPYRLFELAWKRLHSQGIVRLLLAERIEAGQVKLLSGFFYLMWGQTISMTTVGWRQEEQALRPNDILHWQAIQDACTAGFRWYDFGDVELENEGLARYKSKWGAEAKMVYDYSYPITSSRIDNTQESSKKPTQQIVQVVRQHLPIKAIEQLSNLYYAFRLY